MNKRDNPIKLDHRIDFSTKKVKRLRICTIRRIFEKIKNAINRSSS